jgi:hypothetical protein
MRRASAFADAKDAFLVGAGRPSAGGLWRPNSFGVRAGRRPEAFAPIEIGFFGRYAPGVGLRRRKGCLFGRRRPTIGRRLSRRLKSASSSAMRQASAFADAKGFQGFLGRRRPIVGRRLSRRLKSASSGAARRASAFADAKDAFLVGAGRPLAEGLRAD